jgi:hypothetical protein
MADHGKIAPEGLGLLVLYVPMSVQYNRFKNNALRKMFSDTLGEHLSP